MGSLNFFLYTGDLLYTGGVYVRWFFPYKGRFIYKTDLCIQGARAYIKGSSIYKLDLCVKGISVYRGGYIRGPFIYQGDL